MPWGFVALKSQPPVEQGRAGWQGSPRSGVWGHLSASSLLPPLLNIANPHCYSGGACSSKRLTWHSQLLLQGFLCVSSPLGLPAPGEEKLRATEHSTHGTELGSDGPVLGFGSAISCHSIGFSTVFFRIWFLTLPRAVFPKDRFSITRETEIV